jgi:putative ABC transport system substrate-binding protein
MMSRRIGLMFLAMVGLMPAVAPAEVAAQSTTKVPRVGYLTPIRQHDPGDRTSGFARLRQRLADLGYVPDRSVVIESRWAEGRIERLPELAAELVRLDCDVIVATSPPAIRAAKAATATIPIVMAFSGDDPVALGFVKSLARPGGNVTGVMLLAAEMNVKRLEVLKEAVPAAGRFVMWRSARHRLGASLGELEPAMRRLGISIDIMDVRDAQGYEETFAEMARRHVEALVVPTDVIFNRDRRRIIELAIRHRVPTIHEWRESAEEGALIAYGPTLEEVGARAASFVDRILKGAKPADLPVEQPTKFELVVNLKTAKALGVTIPQSILLRADEVIE